MLFRSQPDQASIPTEVTLLKSSLDSHLKPSVLQQRIASAVHFVESNTWNFSYLGKSVNLVTPSELDRALWEKLNAYVALLEPLKP